MIQPGIQLPSNLDREWLAPNIDLLSYTNPIVAI